MRAAVGVDEVVGRRAGTGDGVAGFGVGVVGTDDGCWERRERSCGPEMPATAVVDVAAVVVVVMAKGDEEKEEEVEVEVVVWGARGGRDAAGDGAATAPAGRGRGGK